MLYTVCPYNDYIVIGKRGDIFAQVQGTGFYRRLCKGFLFPKVCVSYWYDLFRSNFAGIFKLYSNSCYMQIGQKTEILAQVSGVFTYEKTAWHTTTHAFDRVYRKRSRKYVFHFMWTSVTLNWTNKKHGEASWPFGEVLKENFALELK